MAEVRHPLSHPRSVGVFVTELVMISVAVFLGLLADQWRESRQFQAAGLAALSRLQAEVLTNQKMVTAERDYHQRMLKDLTAFVNAARVFPYDTHPMAWKTPRPGDRKAFFDANPRLEGTHPIFFEHTAWDLAVVTQALAHIDPDLAYRISRVYTQQALFQTYEMNFVATITTPASLADGMVAAYAESLWQYFGDVDYQEKRLLEQYETLIPAVNQALAAGKP